MHNLRDKEAEQSENRLPEMRLPPHAGHALDVLPGLRAQMAHLRHARDMSRLCEDVARNTVSALQDVVPAR